MPDEKRCTICLCVLPLAAFHKHPKTRDRRSPRCAKCSCVYARQYDLANRDKVRARAKAYQVRTRERRLDRNLRINYGITREDYLALEDSQFGRCAICDGTPIADKRMTHLKVDHDHHTGVVRGLLCGYCNVAIGIFDDSQEILIRAARYLAAPPAQRTDCQSDLRAAVGR